MSLEMNRRQLLQAGVSTLGAVAFAGACAKSAATDSAVAAASGDPGGTLVLLELTGGCDGLSTVVPFGDDGYGRSREKSSLSAKEVLRLDELRGFHPRLVGLHRRFHAGHVAIIEGTGYPDPPYSHFRAQEVWHTARAAGRSSGDGWIGRLREATWSPEEPEELLVHLGGEMPWSMQCSSRRTFSFSTAGDLRWIAAPDAVASMEHLGDAESGASPVLARLREGLAISNRVSQRIVEAVQSYKPRVEYPMDGELGGPLRTIAAMINAGFPTRVYSLRHGNYDVHGGLMKIHHSKLCAELDRSLDAFLSDIAGTPAGKRTAVLMYSEFGRRLQENESGGTDHGAAGPMYLAGECVRGGFHGRRPSLTDVGEDGNLRFTTDFREVYASVVQRLFAADSKVVLGGDYRALPLLA
jgi:uncharacterized protein (DUF1501 family)